MGKEADWQVSGSSHTDLFLLNKDYLNNRRKLYKNKNYKFNIVNKLILNDIADILKHLKDKDIRDKFIKITMNKNKEPNIDIVS